MCISDTKVFGTCEDADKDHDCDYGCDKVFGTCVDTDKDHDCDYGCDKVFGTCEDTDKTMLAIMVAIKYLEPA